MFQYIFQMLLALLKESVKLRTYPEPIFNIGGTSALLDSDFMTQSKQISVHLDSFWYIWRHLTVSERQYYKNILDCYSRVICSLGVRNKIQNLLQFVLYIFRGFSNALGPSLVLPSWTIATKTILQYSLPVGSSPSITIITPVASVVSLYKFTLNMKFLAKSFYYRTQPPPFFFWQRSASHCKFLMYYLALFVVVVVVVVVLASLNNFLYELYDAWTPADVYPLLHFFPTTFLYYLGFDTLSCVQKLVIQHFFLVWNWGAQKYAFLFATFD